MSSSRAIVPTNNPTGCTTSLTHQYLRERPFFAEKDPLDICSFTLYTYVVSLQCKYKEEEEHGKNW
jgi:hypothetical protein